MGSIHDRPQCSSAMPQFNLDDTIDNSIWLKNKNEDSENENNKR